MTTARTISARSGTKTHALARPTDMSAMYGGYGRYTWRTVCGAEVTGIGHADRDGWDNVTPCRVTCTRCTHKIMTDGAPLGRDDREVCATPVRRDDNGRAATCEIVGNAYRSGDTWVRTTA